MAPDERATLLEGRSYEDYLIGRMAEAFAAREEALDTWRRLGDRRREGAALRWLSRLAWSGGRRADAERYAGEAIAVLEPLGLGPELAMAYSNLSQLHMLAGETEGAVTWGDKAIALAERLGDSETLVHALTNVGSAEIRSRPDEGYPKLTRALRLAREGSYQEHVSRCYANFTSFVADRRYQEAEHYLREGLEYTEARDLDFWTAYMRAWRAQLHLDTGALGRGPPRGGRAAGADQALRSGEDPRAGRAGAVPRALRPSRRQRAARRGAHAGGEHGGAAAARTGGAGPGRGSVAGPPAGRRWRWRPGPSTSCR